VTVDASGGAIRSTLRYGECPPEIRRTDQNNNKLTNREIPMAADKSQNVQYVFLNYIRKNKVPVTVFLVNGVKLQGIITWFDNFSVLLRRDAHSQLVYKHAISTVMPATPVQLYEPPADQPHEAQDA
jgi:host factor-I protein